ncbi:CAP domain-containing protein [Cognatishimia sp. MH4019]|uniref:CAP domain-containing protein n=1 Tax=Cognatishimia sp. MH4019 TaxID=2854030 RepID=UPI001CD55B6A|nr:CAP domain-containing protein [Cognatishimia sp. MH4019]
MSCVSETVTNTASTATPTLASSGEFDGMLGLFRAQGGREPVRANTRLAAIAQAHAQDMARNGFFAHKGSDGSTLRQRLRRGGYRACLGAENIGNGYPDQRTAFQGWQASDGHRRNMLLRDVREYGLGRAGPYWVLVLAEPC